MTVKGMYGAGSPVSILETLSALPSGKSGPKLDLDGLGAYLKKHVDTDGEKQRNLRHALRDELYRDGGCKHMEGVIDSVFTDKTIKDLRKKWVKHARFNNPIKRLVNELSTVYAKPAERSVSKDNETYQRLLKAVGMDLQMLQLSRMLNLHRAMLVGFRVRKLPSGQRQPVLDLVSPAMARAVLHPNDAKLVVGWVIKMETRSASDTLHQPCWMLWTDFEVMHLRDDFSVISSSYVEHKFGVCPWVPITLGPPCDGFWPGEEGEDMVAAHTSIWFNNILLLKESKSATKQTVIQGDGAMTARDQAADTEIMTELADGQSASTLDMSMDLQMFTGTTDHVMNTTANNYGMSAAIVSHQGVQSAEARDLMRIPITELRQQQQIPLRDFEESLVIVEAAVLEVDLPELGFDPEGFRVTFDASLTPLPPDKKVDLFVKQRGAGLTNTVDFIAEQNPGMTEDEARAEMEANIGVETERNALMRPLMQISGSADASVASPPATAASAQTSNFLAKSAAGENGGTSQEQAHG